MVINVGSTETVRKSGDDLALLAMFSHIRPPEERQEVRS
jgi:hypothetical protein